MVERHGEITVYKAIDRGSCGTPRESTGVFLSGVDGIHGCRGVHGNDSAELGVK